MSMASDDVVKLVVGGVPFLLEREVVERMGSGFLTKLVDPNIPFSERGKSELRVYADPASFSSILHFFRFNELPDFCLLEPTDVAVKNKQGDFLEQASFWCVVEQIEEAMHRLRETKNRQTSIGVRGALNRRKGELKAALDQSRHHDRRETDVQGNVYCADCGSRDFVTRVTSEQRYDVASGSWVRTRYGTCGYCSKEILYARDLGYCHKCQACRSCQLQECPNQPRPGAGPSAWDQLLTSILAEL